MAKQQIALLQRYEAIQAGSEGPLFAMARESTAVSCRKDRVLLHRIKVSKNVRSSILSIQGCESEKEDVIDIDADEVHLRLDDELVSLSYGLLMEEARTNVAQAIIKKSP